MLAALLRAQNSDGGWGAQPGTPSWTEPTAWAVLSLQGSPGPASEARERGLAYLRKLQRPDGGWPPSAHVPVSNWVTAVIALIPPPILGAQQHQRALRYLESSAEQLPAWTDRLRNWMLGHKPPEGPPARGWSWVPGTAFWLVPTATSLIALRKYGCTDPQLVEHATNYLRARQCADGGWNHGSSRALGYDSPSYPETTGLALIALGSAKQDALTRGLAAAERHAANCGTFEGRCWLRLALHKHGRQIPIIGPTTPAPAPRELALAHIVERSLDGEELL